MRRYKNVLLIMIVCAGIGHWGITNAFGSNVILEFNADGVLPSSQGLTYHVGGVRIRPPSGKFIIFRERRVASHKYHRFRKFSMVPTVKRIRSDPGLCA